ncbi:carboxylate-amine ligase [Actinocatenispora sera]|uniref:Putative glutamate--cysteine ligase 2 n=1 Tax=Actinocatenispora sera TaxID=390989 RepID=A0A810LAU0_9ACTN|nr:glutamate--cysteine ligase [Actinocatenispora sera]BCJ31702.1 putative glutamate--cysteine ligase 2 [Actinocatenispora sera]
MDEPDPDAAVPPGADSTGAGAGPAGAGPVGAEPVGVESVGVEEEFLLVDSRTRRTVPDAAVVLTDCPPVRAELKPELLTSQVELATGVCTDLDELRAQLVEGRRALAEAAARHGDLLVSVGVPPLGGGTAAVAEGDRYTRIRQRYAAVVTDYQACGCHVHVGVPDDEIVPVLGRVRAALPTLVAALVNSPCREGADSGYASWRVVLQSRFPGFGLPPDCASRAEYDRALRRLVDTGAVVDRHMSFWLARRSEHLPTVEFRVADAAGSVDEAVLLAGLIRALVRTARREARAGRPVPAVAPEVAAAAVWSAARYGLDGPGVDPASGRQVPAAQQLRALLRRVRPALAELGDERRVCDGVEALLAGGTGAARQRRFGLADPAALVDWLAARTRAT